MRALVLCLLFSSVAWANAPAPWAVCAGKKAGDKCGSFPYFRGGRCIQREPGHCGHEPGPICLVCESSCAIAPAAPTGIGLHLLFLIALFGIGARRVRHAR